MTIHRIDLRPKTGCGPTPMAYKGEIIGSAHAPIYAAAHLLDSGMGAPADDVATYRDGKLSMIGKAGELAKWSVRENDHGNPTFELVPWRPFPATRFRPETASDTIAAIPTAETIPGHLTGLPA